jgi:hypothetical protein
LPKIGAGSAATATRSRSGKARNVAQHAPCAVDGDVTVAGRRERQLIELLRLFAHGERRRAACLAMEHSMEFPGDADALAGVAEWISGATPTP